MTRKQNGKHTVASAARVWVKIRLLPGVAGSAHFAPIPIKMQHNHRAADLGAAPRFSDADLNERLVSNENVLATLEVDLSETLQFARGLHAAQPSRSHVDRVP